MTPAEVKHLFILVWMETKHLGSSYYPALLIERSDNDLSAYRSQKNVRHVSEICW